MKVYFTCKVNFLLFFFIKIRKINFFCGIMIMYIIKSMHLIRKIVENERVKVLNEGIIKSIEDNDYINIIHSIAF